MTAVVVGLRLPSQQAASGCREGRRDCLVSCALLCFSGVTELAGVFIARSAEPLHAVSRCGEAPRHLVEPTRLDLDEGPLAGPVVLPSNLEVAAVFRPFLDEMWQVSPTFKGQWRRFAAATGLHVSVLVDDLPPPARTVRARTVLRHQGGALVSARVYLKPTLDAAEVIAHELEHILEQLDGVDLQAQAGNGVVWEAGDGAFETRRAIEAGRRVAREITTGSDVAGVQHLPHENHADRLTTVVQQDPNATPSSGRSARVSGSGRYVVFVSSAQLVEADRNRFEDVYVLDLATGECTLESAGPDGSPGNGDSFSPDISRDGRYVVFASASSNLLDTQVLPGVYRVFLRDREQGATRLLSPAANGGPEHGISENPAISADGTMVVFESTATDLAESGDTARSSAGIYLIRLTSGQRTRLDLTSAGGRPAGESMSPAISADGRFVAFASKGDLTCGEASTCVTEPSDKKGVAAIYLRDTHTNTTKRVTRSYAGGDPNGPSYQPTISGDWAIRGFRFGGVQPDARSHQSYRPHLCARPCHRNHRSRQPRAEWASRKRAEPAASAVSGRRNGRVSVAGQQSCVRRQMPRGAARHQPGLGRIRL